jgi:hypothetical protein
MGINLSHMNIKMPSFDENTNLKNYEINPLIQNNVNIVNNIDIVNNVNNVKKNIIDKLPTEIVIKIYKEYLEPEIFYIRYKDIIEQAFGKIIESSAILLKNIIEGIDVDNNLYEERILNLMKNIVSSIVVCIPVLKKKDFDVFIQVYNQNLDQNHDINTIIAKPLIRAKNLQKTEIFTRAFDEVAQDYENRMDQLHQDLLNYSVNFKRT